MAETKRANEELLEVGRLSLFRRFSLRCNRLSIFNASSSSITHRKPERAKIKEKLPSFNSDKLKFWICPSTGWADCIVILASDNYAIIQLSISLLRNITIDDILNYYGVAVSKDMNEPFHAIITSCTIPGVQINFGQNGQPDEKGRAFCLKNLLDKVDSNDKFTIPICELQTRPGHLTHAINLCNQYDTFPTFGRTDLMVMDIEGTGNKTSEFMKFFVMHLLPAMNESSSSIISSETNICFIGDIFKCESDKAPLKQRYTPRQFTRLDAESADTLKDAFSAHTLSAIRQMGESLFALMHDEATSEYYTSLVSTYEAAIHNLVKTSSEIIKAQGKPDVMDKLSANLSTFCEMMDLCFTDRYRGTYPAGASAALPSLTSTGSFHKILAAADSVANSTLEAMHDQCRAHCKAKGFDDPILLENAACCHLGNSSSPRVNVPHIVGVGFINVPSHLMFDGEGLIYIIHETGHIFWDHLMNGFSREWDYVWKQLPSQSQKILREALADAVSLAIGFRGDVIKLFQVSKSVLNSIVPSSQYHSAEQTLLARAVLADFLLQIGKRSAISEDVVVDIWEQMRSNPPKHLERAFRQTDKFIEAASLLVKTDESFGLMLQALAALADDDVIKGLGIKRKNILIEVRKFLSQTSTVEEGICFLHRIGQIQRVCETE